MALVSKRMRLSPSHQRAKAQETETAKRLGGKQVKGSGSGYQKGDVRVRGIARIECKTTKHKSFSVTLADVEKIEAATFGACELPVIEVELDNQCKRAKVVVLPAWALDVLLDALKSR